MRKNVTSHVLFGLKKEVKEGQITAKTIVFLLKNFVMVHRAFLSNALFMNLSRWVGINRRHVFYLFRCFTDYLFHKHTHSHKNISIYMCIYIKRVCIFVTILTFSMNLTFNFEIKTLLEWNRKRVILSSAALKKFFDLNCHWNINNGLKILISGC